MAVCRNCKKQVDENATVCPYCHTHMPASKAMLDFKSIIVGILISVVLAQSVYFLLKAMKRAKEVGIETSTIKKTISSSVNLFFNSFFLQETRMNSLTVSPDFSALERRLRCSSAVNLT